MKMIDISATIHRFYDPISNYDFENPGGPDTRYKSWEWCHEAFLEGKADYDAAKSANDINKQEEIIDHLCLHLAFYLASWGMYRGSAFLLQRDYLAHQAAVKDILEFDDKKLLWDYIPNANNIVDANDLLFCKNNGGGIYWKIKDDYKGYPGQTKYDEPTDTLITKILMGTFGCIPAFDRYLKEGIDRYLQLNGGSVILGGYALTSEIEKTQKKTAKETESFMALAQFAIKEKSALTGGNIKIITKTKSIDYPMMKLVDMFFWEIGYERDIKSTLDDKVNKLGDKLKENVRITGRDTGKIRKALPIIKKLNIYQHNLSNLDNADLKDLIREAKAAAQAIDNVT